MPMIPEIGAIWDAMRPAYREVLAGRMEARDAAARMQEQAILKTEELNR